MVRKVELKQLLSEYFENDTPTAGVSNRPSVLTEIASSSPIQPQVCSWEVYDSPERFSKTFSFQSRQRLADFVNDVLTFEDEFGHHGMHKIDSHQVAIEVYTHDINRITNLDQEYIRSIDMIYEDVLHYAY
jgi:pterin-4a-carbinolamine dehydratase